MKKVLAFDIGGTNTRVALVNEDFIIEQSEIVPTIRDNVEAFLNNINKLIDRFDLDDVIAFGAGVPGVVNRETGFIYDLPNVHIKNIDLGKHLFEKYHRKVFLRNDAEVACLAEAYGGAGCGAERVFFITISTGLGGALVIDRENQDYVTEIGHTAYQYKGKMYDYEYLASGTGIVHLAELNGLHIQNSKEFFELVSKSDMRCVPIYKEWQAILKDFITMIQNSYEPDVICVTGGVMKAKRVFFATMLSENPHSNIVECEFKEEAGLTGAAIYAFKMMKCIE